MRPLPLSDQDHQMLLKHGKELWDHERRITDLNNKMTDTLKSVDESNKYLREQNNRILEAVIRGDEKSENHKNEMEVINRQNLWKVVTIAIGSSSVIYLILQQLMHFIH
ncbi:hypothetical protein [Lentilactobacillus otakiensis]|uniref:hypothetical protein n=1 Tax=Lentilactobacillus otakiensis TaxID=481720 RepID=UPI00293CB619|nr:hypothetical protein [Lentilactobacillus otakiensis]MDV3518208.1 hypothetical protein [Lentilactobacillus otakiensis]